MTERHPCARPRARKPASRRPGRAALCGGVVLAALLLAAPAGAESADKQTGVMQPEALEAFERMSTYLGEADTISFTTTAMRESATPAGIKHITARSAAIVIRRPDSFHARIERDDGRESRVWFDGTTLAMAVADGEGTRYATLAVPDEAKTIDGLLDYLIDEYDFVLQLGDLMYSDVQATLGDALLSAVHLGRKVVDGRPCHHLSLEFAGADAQLWVQDGDDPAPCRWAFVLHEEPSEPLFVSSFDAWVTNPAVDPALFSFAAPAGATEVDAATLLSANAQGE